MKRKCEICGAVINRADGVKYCQECSEKLSREFVSRVGSVYPGQESWLRRQILRELIDGERFRRRYK